MKGGLRRAVWDFTSHNNNNRHNNINEIFRCRSHCDGCMNLAWDSCWGGSRSTKPCVFWCKVAVGGDEGYLLCAAVAVWIVSTRNWFSLGVLQCGDANRIVMAQWMCAWCCKTHCSGSMTVAWGLCWGGSRSTKPCVFRVKCLQAAMKGTSCVRRVRPRSF